MASVLKMGMAIGLSLLASLVGASARAQVTMSIDTSQTFQTMDGFGFAAIGEWYTEIDLIYAKPEFADYIYREVNPAIIRLELRPEVKEIYDPDLEDLNLGAYDMSQFRKGAVLAQNLYAKNPNLKVILTPWTPPGWMKINNSWWGGYLEQQYYKHFAKYLAGACKKFEEHFGIPLYAISVQNEPRFENPFYSCVYEPDWMRDTIVEIDWAWKKWGITNQVMASENHGFVTQGWLIDYAAAIYGNPLSRDRVGIHAVHGFPSNGIEDKSTLAGWQNFVTAMQPYPYPTTWMTEDSGQSHHWLGKDNDGKGALEFARRIHNALVGGNINAWVSWVLSDPDVEDSRYALMNRDQPTNKLHVFRHFSKYIRPGAHRVAAAASNRSLAVSAYLDTTTKMVTIVVINLGGQSSSEKLSITLPPKTGIRGLMGIRSSPSEQSVTLPTMKLNPDGTITVAVSPYSLTTLQARYYPKKK
jgi:glucuronoarabinoxylan endo-1,4-beta-xylanase